MRFIITILLSGSAYCAIAQSGDAVPATLVNKKWYVKRQQRMAPVAENELAYKFKKPGKPDNMDVTIKGNVTISRTWYDISVPGAPRIAIQEQNAAARNYYFVKTLYTDKGKKEYLFFDNNGFRRMPVFEQMRLENP